MRQKAASSLTLQQCQFNNDVAGTSGVYQAGIRSSFTPTLSGHLSVSYGNGAGVESPWNTQAGVVWTF
ncbi:TPA: autotransporter outer membrane beta-barrel domain-containing protein [Escherichia coli]